MVAFICLCGKSTTSVDYTVPSEKNKHVRICCSKECKEKFEGIYIRGYIDGYSDGKQDKKDMKEATRENRKFG